MCVCVCVCACVCEKWPTYHVAVLTGNAVASQQSVFRENRRPSSAAKKVSIICGTNNYVKSEMLSDRHTHTGTTSHVRASEHAMKSKVRMIKSLSP